MAISQVFAENKGTPEFEPWSLIEGLEDKPVLIVRGETSDLFSAATANRMLAVLPKAELITIPCACGVQIRVPHNLERDTFPCPRCGREHPMPRAAASGAAESAAATPVPHKLRYERKAPGWEAFKCGCGKAIQLSPAFEARMVRCHGCGREIEIAGAGQHLPKQRVAARFNIGRTEALDGDRGVALGNSRCSPDHGETDDRQGGRPFRPPRHHRTARPFREASRLIPANSAPSARTLLS